MFDKAKDLQAEVAKQANRIWLAGLGALASAQEEGGKLFDTLVAKGEAVQADFIPVSKVNETLDQAKGKATDAIDAVQKSLDEQVTLVLHKIGVPTREEIAKLTKRVEELNATLDGMKSKKAKEDKAE